MLSFMSCQEYKTPFEEKIEVHLAQHMQNDQMQIDLNEFTDFDWEVLYVFRETATLSQIEDVMGTSYPYFEDVARRLVFMKENQIMHHEAVFPNVEGILSGQALFSIPDTSHYITIYPQKINVHKKQLDKGYYYALEH